MLCDVDPVRLAAYLDGELSAEQAIAMKQHIAGCTHCAAEVAEQVSLKHELREARARFVPGADLRSRVLKQVSAKKGVSGMKWFWPTMAWAAALLLVVASWFYFPHRSDAFSEVADLHINALASTNPLDVVSSDRHTVKPWFQGRIPFSFNVPEFGGSEFMLLGGRMVYLHQQPGAQLFVGMKQHKISVLIFQESSEMDRAFPETSGVQDRNAFRVETWHTSSLRFVVIGDSEAAAIDGLGKMLQQANP